MLDAAERQPRIGLHHAVDEDRAGIDAADERIALRIVARPGARAKPERRRVRDAYGVRHRSDLEQKRHRPEELFLCYRPGWVDVRDDSRRIEAALALERRTSREDFPTGGHEATHLIVDALDGVLVDERPDIGLLVHRITDDERFELRDHAAFEG